MENIVSLLELIDVLNNIEITESNKSEIDNIIRYALKDFKNKKGNNDIEVKYLHNNKENMKKINKNFFSELGKFKKIKKNDTIITQKLNCSICLQKYIPGEYKRTLPNCEHVFHKKCIDKWLKKTDCKHCPLCRKSYTKIYRKCENHIAIVL